MPKYAVDFLADIQELTSATNLDDYSDSVDLLTNLNLFNVPVERSSEENNVVNALMGNAQCCFKRYPGYQAHRHVVVSRGVQCSEANIKKLIENDLDCTENNNLFRTRATERGDVINESLYKELKSPDNESIVPLKVSTNHYRNGSVFKRKPEIFTPVTQEPPELRDSSKFFRKHFSIDYKKHRKYFEDDIDSLSATISNYSLHDKLLRLEENGSCNKVPEIIDQNNHHKFNPNVNHTPSIRQSDFDFKGSTEAIKGSMTRSLTGKSQLVGQVKREFPENQSSDSYTSFGNIKENKSTLVSNSGDNTQETNLDEIDKRKYNHQTTNVNNANNEKSIYPPQQMSCNLIQAFSQQPGKMKSLSSSLDRNPSGDNCANSSDNKLLRNSSSSVTFMKGSEELKKYEQQKLSEAENLNALRKKQRFIMKHTRTNSKINLINNYENPVSSVPDSPQPIPFDKNDNHTAIANRSHQTIEYCPAPAELPVPKSPLRNHPPNPANFDSNRNSSISRNSNHTENVSQTPTTPNIQKIKRTVSFDRNNKPIDKSISLEPVVVANPTETTASQPCSRNTVRAKYCTKKVIKQKFYVPESANIEQILRDPSDRRIKAICDRHNCDIEIYSKVPKCGFLKNIIILAAPNNENLRKCVRSLDYSMHWCLAAQLS